jgi:predicted ribonuclease YlaK
MARKYYNKKEIRMTRKRQPVTETEEQALEGRYNKNEPRPVVGKSNALKIKLDHMRTIDPMTENQQKFWSAYDIGTYAMMLTGSPGTGKTLISLYKALTEVLDKDTPYSRVIVVRSVVTGRETGALPGSLEDKLSPFMACYDSICEFLFNRKDAFARLVEQGVIEYHSTSFLRGITWDDAVIVFDEFQNEGWNTIKSVISRVGNRSKIILCGDFKQNDLNKNKWDQSGFQEIFRVAEAMEEFEVIQFTPDDILRSSFTRNFIIKCEELGV